MSTDFWKFWSSENGFDKKAWLEAYEGARNKKSTSPTRTVINIIVGEASPVRILETNIYAKEARRPRDLLAKDKDTRPIDFLIEKIQPRMIVAHGVKAQRYLIRQEHQSGCP